MTDDSYRLIPLTMGKFAKVDAADYDWLMQWKWQAVWRKGSAQFYAAHKGFGAGTHLRMHRLILGLTPGDGLQADHINRDGLDNRRINLRIASASQNNSNKGVSRINKSGYKGVTWQECRKQWRAYINVKGKRYELGYFATAELAHVEYCKAAMQLHGEFARFR